MGESESKPAIQYFGNDGDDDGDDIIGNLDALSITPPPCNEVHLVPHQSSYQIRRNNTGNSTNTNFNVNYYEPHERSDPYKRDKNLIGEVLYCRDGKPVKEDTGIFGLKDPDDLKKYAGQCKPDTHHARLHKCLYGKCPEEEKDLVATGFSNQKTEGLVFRSATFNKTDKSYLDPKCYQPNTTKHAGKDEQEAIRRTMHKWSEDNCPRKNWRFSTKSARQKRKP